MLILVFAAQLAALVVICARLAPGRHRLPEVEPDESGESAGDTTVTVVVPARNEATRITPCLDGLRAQRAPLTEVIVVDGHSTDATPAIVRAAAQRDPRVRMLEEPVRPAGCVGRPWAIAAGCAQARGEWVMVVDADTAPRAGMVAGAVAAANRLGLDAVSFAPRILAPAPGARWLQPSLLTTLVYRFGAAGLTDADPERVMANGQCMLMRRDVLQRAGGYGVADDSFCDDIRVARHLASAGAHVGFLDGPRLLDVTMYPTARETWRAWPPSLHMRDATRLRWRWFDAVVLLLAQALPIPLLLLLALTGRFRAPHGVVAAILAVNGGLLLVRVLLGFATAHSFGGRGVPYWLAPLADPFTVPRVIWTMIASPREWRGTPRDAGGAMHAHTVHGAMS